MKQTEEDIHAYESFHPGAHIKGEICNIIAVINHKETMIYQRSRKHAKLKYSKATATLKFKLMPRQAGSEPGSRLCIFR